MLEYIKRLFRMLFTRQQLDAIEPLHTETVSYERHAVSHVDQLHEFDQKLGMGDERVIRLWKMSGLTQDEYIELFLSGRMLGSPSICSPGYLKRIWFGDTPDITNNERECIYDCSN